MEKFGSGIKIPDAQDWYLLVLHFPDLAGLVVEPPVLLVRLRILVLRSLVLLRHETFISGKNSDTSIVGLRNVSIWLNRQWFKHALLPARAMFIHWMFSNRTQGEQWVQRATMRAGGNGHPGNYRLGAGMGR
jgi:hypothetical protein